MKCNLESPQYVRIFQQLLTLPQLIPQSYVMSQPHLTQQSSEEFLTSGYLVLQTYLQYLRLCIPMSGAVHIVV